jgi:hypothetical protein
MCRSGCWQLSQEDRGWSQWPGRIEDESESNACFPSAQPGAERIAILENMAANLRQLEQFAEAQYQAAQATFDAVLEAKAARLQAEIRLVREKKE